MKKTVAIILSLILCVSLATSAFAATATSVGTGIPASSGTSYTIPVIPVDDTDVEPNEEVIVQELSNGNVVVTIPEAAVENEAAVVEIPTEVESANSADSASTISISAPKSSSSVKVSIPVPNKSLNTVAILVAADGTEKVIKTSTINENGIVFNVEGDATVKIVENEKEVPDLADWEKPGVAFATSHELFVGDENGAFLPDHEMNKAMVVTILSRIEDDTMTTTGENWYAESLAWATSAGLTDDSNPTGVLTRADMILMLYKYAGSPATDYDLSAFTDAGDLSGEYLAAMQWAVSKGIVIGVGNNMLAPFGSTTRATFATLMMRYCAIA